MKRGTVHEEGRRRMRCAATGGPGQGDYRMGLFFQGFMAGFEFFF